MILDDDSAYCPVCDPAFRAKKYFRRVTEKAVFYKLKYKTLFYISAI